MTVKTILVFVVCCFFGVAMARIVRSRRKTRRLDTLRRARRYLHYARDLEYAGKRNPARLIRWAVKRGVLKRPRRLK